MVSFWFNWIDNVQFEEFLAEFYRDVLDRGRRFVLNFHDPVTLSIHCKNYGVDYFGTMEAVLVDVVFKKKIVEGVLLQVVENQKKWKESMEQ